MLIRKYQPTACKIGNLLLSHPAPVRLQSMTNTPTTDVEATVAQCIRIFEVGGELVRITVPSLKEVESFRAIKERLSKEGYTFPLVADVHFNPKVAEALAGVADKIRINPGNYVDKKAFRKIDYTPAEYQAELDAIETRLTPLLDACALHGTALRIGTNHGSLSDRIMSRYGDTPEGMAESAMEFVRICHHRGFHNLVLSMKASNTRIMVYATRLLVHKMLNEGMLYPVHLGVTEAGEGEDGRIRSAVGIGTLLSEGIGDTVRVSLTEAPEAEIPVAALIVRNFLGPDFFASLSEENPFSAFEYKKITSRQVAGIGGNQSPRVMVSISHNISDEDTFMTGTTTPEFLFLPAVPDKWPQKVSCLLPYDIYKQVVNPPENVFPYLNGNYMPEDYTDKQPFFYQTDALALAAGFAETIKKYPHAILVIPADHPAESRIVAAFLAKHQIDNPVVIGFSSDEAVLAKFQIDASCQVGPLLIDGVGDALWLDAPSIADKKVILSTAFNILQAARVRVTKTEFISCPGCGRTQFDLQGAVAKVKARTGHLKDLKIAVMGCIVNGPGEMADADYGYVGAGEGKINLYRRKELVQRAIPEAEAVDALIAMIKENGDWRG